MGSTQVRSALWRIQPTLASSGIWTFVHQLRNHQRLLASRNSLGRVLSDRNPAHAERVICTLVPCQIHLERGGFPFSCLCCIRGKFGEGLWIPPFTRNTA